MDLELRTGLKSCGADPELFAGLVQACCYCGLLEASAAAHERARRLDATIRTSIPHTYLVCVIIGT